MGFSRQEYWSGLPFLSPGDLLDPGVKPWSPASQVESLLPGNSLAIQWLGLCAFTAKGLSLIPGLGTKIPRATQYGKKEKKHTAYVLGDLWFQIYKSKYLIHLRLFLYIWYEKVIQFDAFAWSWPVFPTPFIIFSSLYILASFVVDCVFLGLFLGYSIPLICVSVLVSVTYTSDSCSFVV